VIKISDNDLHAHLKARMEQRGITKEEKVFVFQYNQEWQGEVFEEKEVSVYYKLINDDIMLLTVKARYGKDFSREGEKNEIRI
jgi:hypothetical protein